jgi:hypothetical protein
MKHMKVVSKDAPSVASIWSCRRKSRQTARTYYAALLATLFQRKLRSDRFLRTFYLREHT